MTPHGYIQYPAPFCKVSWSILIIFVFKPRCVWYHNQQRSSQTFFLSLVTDNSTILKINFKSEHHFSASFQKHFDKLPLRTHSLLILTTCTYTDNYVGNTLWCELWQMVCCYVIENVLKVYVNATLTIQKERDTCVVYAYSAICICPKHLPTKPDENNRNFEGPRCWILLLEYSN